MAAHEASLPIFAPRTSSISHWYALARKPKHHHMPFLAHRHDHSSTRGRRLDSDSCGLEDKVEVGGEAARDGGRREEHSRLRGLEHVHFGFKQDVVDKTIRVPSCMCAFVRTYVCWEQTIL